MNKHEYMITRMISDGNGGSAMVLRTCDKRSWIQAIRREMQDRGITQERIAVIEHEGYTVCCMADNKGGYISLQFLTPFSAISMKRGVPKEVLI